MTVVIALVMAVAVLLTASPLLWPRQKDSAAASSGHDNNPATLLLQQALERARTQLAAAGLPRVSLVSVVTSSALLATVVAAITFAFLPIVSLAIAVSVATLTVPMLLIRRRAASAHRAARVLWPDVVDHMVSAVRSGLSLPDSLSVLAHTGPVITRRAFASFEAQYRSTSDFSHCIDDLKDYLSDPIADRILETLRMSREVGGSELTTVLRNLAAYLRQDAAIRSEVEARQSWVMNSARLGVAAPWVVLALLSTRPEAALAYNTTAGAVVVVGGLGLSIAAYQVMVGLGRIPPERRWFR